MKATFRQGELVEGHKDVTQLTDRKVCMKVRNKDTHVVLGYITVNDASKGGAINAELVKTPRRDTQAPVSAQRAQQHAKTASEDISPEDLVRTDEINGGILSWDQVANPANQVQNPRREN